MYICCTIVKLCIGMDTHSSKDGSSSLSLSLIQKMALQGILKLAYRTFLLFHGFFEDIIDLVGQSSLVQQLSDFYSTVRETQWMIRNPGNFRDYLLFSSAVCPKYKF